MMPYQTSHDAGVLSAASYSLSRGCARNTLGSRLLLQKRSGPRRQAEQDPRQRHLLRESAAAGSGQPSTVRPRGGHEQRRCDYARRQRGNVAGRYDDERSSDGRVAIAT